MFMLMLGTTLELVKYHDLRLKAAFKGLSLGWGMPK